MSRLVVDASITLAWCFPDEQAPPALKILERLKAGDQALVPHFWYLEILNSLLIAERRGRISAEQTKVFLADLTALAPSFDFASIENVTGSIQKLCRDYGLTPYDALYVDLALRTKSALATLDEAQRRAAVSLHIECL